MGVIPATSIGLGAMLGAGIFVFPGIAGGYTGMAATLSFFTGGVIALLVALCTAELATAMPQSGGGYFFISRTFGQFWGTLVGIAQWIGLIFASAFYLVSFGEYAISLLDEIGVNHTAAAWIFSLTFTFLLLIINIFGTKGVGRIQNIMVISLALILVMIFTYGLIDYLGLSENEIAADQFAPEGTLSIFTTTALIFTSYLGFVQIANIGGEIKKPNRNLPRSLIGSVLIAIALYIFVMFVCTSTFEHNELRKYGETATIEVARELVGNWGAGLTVFAGLLAALSSANASIISASRGVFALSKDNLIDHRASRVNKRFGTPHIAVLLVTLPIAILLLKKELEIFAEVASILHLIIYGGICLSVLKLNFDRPNWYIPTFRLRFVKSIAVMGALSCFGLVFFMQTASLLLSLFILALASLYFLLIVRKRKVAITHPEPPHVDTSMLYPDVLIPIPLDEDKKDLPLEIVDSIPIRNALLVGYRTIPEQSEGSRSEEEFTDEIEDKLEKVSQRLNEKSIEIDKRIIFENDALQQIQKVIEENRPSYILQLQPYSSIERIVIPISERSQIRNELSTLAYKLSANYEKPITVLLIPDNTSDRNSASNLKNVVQQEFKRVYTNINDYIISENSQDELNYTLQDTITKTDLMIWSCSEKTEDQKDAILKNVTDYTDLKIPLIVIPAD